MTNAWIEKVKELVAPICEREGCKLYDVESSGSKSSKVVKVYIEGLDSSVTIDQCANVSNSLSLLLDVEDIVPGGKYNLEVSSPGLERNLKEVWHYQSAINKTVKVKTSTAYMPIEGPETKKGVKLIQGQLSQVNDDSFVVEDNKKRLYKIDYTNVNKANVVFEFNNTKKAK